MEIPDLVRDRLGDEEILAGVSLGDEDVVCLTPTRTLVYRGEGLLSEESVAVLPHDVERIDVNDGRRKTKFSFEYVDSVESFTVPRKRSEKVLELVIEGVLQVAEVTDPDESVRGVYRFSELTLIVTDGRLVKHVGSHLWDADHEEYPFADVTALAFEEGSVATQIVISVDGRPERIKAPNDDAPALQRTLSQAVFDYHDVESMAELEEAVGIEPEEDESTVETSASSDLTFDTGIDPLVGGTDDEPEPPETDEVDANAPAEATAPDPGGESVVTTDEPLADPAGENAGTSLEPNSVSPEDIEQIDDRLDSLTTAVKRQNQLLRKQHEALQQLVTELRQGR